MILSPAQIVQQLRAANQVALDALAQGHHPFGAVLIGPDGEEVLMQQGNINTVQHAETELARRAAASYSPEFLWDCALVTTIEPCAMCAGTQYWANIGTLVYGVSEETLLELTGSNPENPTMSLPSRTVFASGQKDITVYGPIPEMSDEICQPHLDFWK